MAELKQALLSRLAGGVTGVNAAAATTGAAQDIDAEGVLMKGCPVEPSRRAGLLLLW
jgi:L-lactate utilization protein LutB